MRQLRTTERTTIILRRFRQTDTHTDRERQIERGGKYWRDCRRWAAWRQRQCKRQQHVMRVNYSHPQPRWPSARTQPLSRWTAAIPASCPPARHCVDSAPPWLAPGTRTADALQRRRFTGISDRRQPDLRLWSLGCPWLQTTRIGRLSTTRMNWSRPEFYILFTLRRTDTTDWFDGWCNINPTVNYLSSKQAVYQWRFTLLLLTVQLASAAYRAHCN